MQKFFLANAIFIWNDAGMIVNTVATTSTAPMAIISKYTYTTLPLPEVQLVDSVASTIPVVPFYSQFRDITSATWQKVGCGVTSLAMVIDYYQPQAVSVDTLLKQGIAAGAYLSNAGWTHAGLISLSQKYGLSGKSYDLAALDSTAAFAQLKTYLDDGPVIVSIHYKFDPKSTIPHLVVINGIENGTLHYNDPAAKSGDKEISVADFLKGWKKRFIVIRPTTIGLSLNTVNKV